MNEITGVIEQGDLKATFTGQNHRFIFLPTEQSAQEILPGVTFNSHDHGTLKPANNFLRGRSYDGKYVLIFCNKDIHLQPTASFTTWLYIVSSKAIEHFDGIRFAGGSLNSVFVQRSFITDFKKGMPHMEYQNDQIVIPIGLNGVKEFRIHSGIQEFNSLKKGRRVENTGVVFDLIFDKTQNIDDGIRRNYNDIFTMLQFMTFRKNVAFEKMELVKKRPDSCFYSKIATCYVENDIDFPREGDVYTNVRDHVRCIGFDKLQPEVVKNLYKTILSRNGDKSKYSVNFIPESKNEVPFLTKQQIRDICTSLELETVLAGVKASHEIEFDDLIKTVKKVVKDTRKSQKPLTDREYSYISNNINYWVGPAAELDKKLYDLHKDEAEPLIKFYGLKDLSEDDVQGVIRLRNNLTHRGVSDVNQKDIGTACVLMGVVYSAILSRCGCEKERIKSFFEWGLLTEAD